MKRILLFSFLVLSFAANAQFINWPYKKGSMIGVTVPADVYNGTSHGNYKLDMNDFLQKADSTSYLTKAWYKKGMDSIGAVISALSIPTNNNQLTNGAGYITSAALSPYLLKADSTLYSTKAGRMKSIDSLAAVINSALSLKQGSLTITTTGTSGPATLVGNTLNIPQYSGGGGGASYTFDYGLRESSGSVRADSLILASWYRLYKATDSLKAILQSAIALKLNISDTLPLSNRITTNVNAITALQSGKANTSHSHVATDVTEDATHRFVSESEKATWNGKLSASDTTNKWVNYIKKSNDSVYFRIGTTWHLAFMDTTSQDAWVHPDDFEGTGSGEDDQLRIKRRLYWDSAYAKIVDSVKVTGGSTKTLTVYFHNGTTYTTTFTDNEGAGGGGSSSPAAVSAKATAALTIPTSTDYVVPFDTENFDTDDFYVPGTTNTRFTVPVGKAGYYQVNGFVTYPAASNSNASRMAKIRKNGTTILSIASIRASQGAAHAPVVSALIYLAEGDYIELIAHTSEGATTSGIDGFFAQLGMSKQ